MRWLRNLRRRGLVDAVTSEAVADVLQQRSSGDVCSAYVGFDPTAPSLHIGNLTQLVTLRHLQLAGFRPIALIGTATGFIGDPSGKSAERQLLDQDQLRENTIGIRRSVERVLTHWTEQPGVPPPLVLENAPFYASLTALEFLRDVGRNFRVSSMLGRESVRARLDSGAGLSYTEFSYQVLQAWDFWRLFRDEKCVLQLGGSDQWGNITAGVDLIRRKEGEEAFGLTVPLLTNASGEKLGKSEGNALWLNHELTSDFHFYQFFLQQADEDLSVLFRRLTFLDDEEIESLLHEHMSHPEKRSAQRRLAEEVTTLVRGDAAVRRAQQATEALFRASADISDLSPEAVRAIVSAARDGSIPAQGVSSAATLAGQAPLALLRAANLTASNAESKRLMRSGAVLINGRRCPVEEATRPIGIDALLRAQLVVVQSGKKRRVVFYVEET